MDKQAQNSPGSTMPRAEHRGARPTLDSIQYLRGVAAMLVVLFHVFPQLERMGYRGERPLALSAGVDVFFVISGFVMVYSTARNPDRGGLAFLRDRLVRIAPLYWVLSLVMLALLIVVPSIAQSSRLDTGHVLASFLFVPWMHPVQHLYYPMLVPGWSLNYEMFFYLIFAGALSIAKGQRGRVVMITCGSLFVLALLPIAAPLPGVLGFYTRSLILEFGYGMLLAEAFLRRPFAISPLWWFAIMIGAVVLAVAPLLGGTVPQAFAVGLPALLVVLGTLYIPVRLNGWFKRVAHEIGDASYSIYLSHYLAMSALGQIWRKLVSGSPLAWTCFTALSVVTCAIGGVLVYRIVELPLSRLIARSRETADIQRKKTKERSSWTIQRPLL